MPIATTNPATGEVIKTFEPLSAAQIDEKLQLAVAAFHAEQKTTFADRSRRMQNAADILERDKEQVRSSDDAGNGQALQSRRRRGRQVRRRLPLLRRQCRRNFSRMKSSRPALTKVLSATVPSARFSP